MAKLTRREFIKILNRVLAITGLAAIIGPVVAYFFPASLEETPSTPVNAGKLDDLPIGTAKKIPFGRYPALIIHTEAGVKAYSAVCTHFACICSWDESKKIISCPCHEGHFDPSDGHVISGPPPSPLEQFRVEIKDGDIYISAGGEA